MVIIKKLLTYCLYLIGKKNEEPKVSEASVEDESPQIGTNGPLNCDVIVLAEGDKVVLAVDHEFTDVPEWVEWDVPRGIFGIVQMGGATAEIKSVIPAEKVGMLKDKQNILLTTKYEGKKIVQSVHLVVRT